MAERLYILAWFWVAAGLVYSVEVRVDQKMSNFFEGENITLECYGNLTKQQHCIRSNTIWLKRRWGSSLIIRGESNRKLNLTLKMLDTGYYSCEIEGRTSAEFYLRVQGSLRLSKLSRRPVAYDDIIKLTCTPPPNENITHYIWKDNGITQSETSDKFTKQFGTQDQYGNITCAAINSNNNSSIETVGLFQFYDIFNVHVHATPSPNVIEGTSVTLTCSESSNAIVYQYEWLKGRQVVGNSPTLTLESIQREDSGRYYCRVSATIPNTTRTITWASSEYLHVKHEPAPVTINQENDIIEQKQGTSFSAKCFTDNLGYPEGRLDWFKDNCTYNITTKIVRRENFFVGLYFTNLKPQDMGTYKCQITNDLGRQVKIFQLVVSDKPGEPFNFTVQSTTANSIYFMWKAPRTNAIPGTIFYRIYYQHSNENMVYKNASSATVYNLTGLIPAKTYTIYVTAVNKFFESDPSNQINQTTRAGAPLPFVGTLPTPSAKSIRKTSFVIKLVEFSEVNGNVTRCDVVVSKLDSDEVPDRDPITYTDNDIREGVDGLYVAIRSAGAPKKGMEIVIGDDFNYRKRRSVDELLEPSNKALDSNSYYTLFLRVYVTDDIYTSTGWYPVVLTLGDDECEEETSAALIACIVIIVVIVLINCLIGILYWKHWKTVRVKEDEEELQKASSVHIQGENPYMTIGKKSDPRNERESCYGFENKLHDITRDSCKETLWSKAHTNMEYDVPTNYESNEVYIIPNDANLSLEYISIEHSKGTSSKEYIAIQGPINQSLNGLWEIAWRTNSHTIISLEKLNIKNSDTISNHWIEDGIFTVEDLQISQTKSYDCPAYKIRSFTLTKKGNPVDHLIKHFHFTSWHNFGLPKNLSHFLSFIRIINKWNKSFESKKIINSPDPDGKVELYVTIDKEVKKIQEKKAYPNIQLNEPNLSKEDYSMLKTENQCKFVRDAITRYLEMIETEINVDEINDYISQNSETNSKTGQTGFMDEFIRLSDINVNDRAEEGKRVVNQMKNRYAGLYPYDDTRVKLTLRPGIDGSDYINANYIESFLQKDRFIATQAPLEHTFEDFWRMIWEQNCQTIVMVSKEREKKQTKSYIYWPQEIPLEVAHYVIERSDVSVFDDYIVRKLNVTNTKESSSRNITQFQYTSWPDDSVPETGAAMIKLIEEVHRWNSSVGNEITTVHCSSGIGRTGVFIALSNLIDQIITEGVVNVYQTAKRMRQQRSSKILTRDQYEFCYHVVQEYLDAVDIYDT